MTKRARVRAIYTSNMDDLARYVPQDPERFCVSVRAMVGPETGEGEESFDISVCTPKWLEYVCQRDGFVIGRHYLMVNDYNVPHLKKLIVQLIEKCEGSSWREAAEKVGRIGYWEFEDYTPAPQQR